MAHSNNGTDFGTKFHAYRITDSGILTKRYVYPPFGECSMREGEAELTEEQIRTLSLALGSPCFSTLDTERFPLYEISFRGEGGAEEVSFNFIDVKDRDYLSAAEVFSSISGFDTAPLVGAVDTLERSVFPNGVDYNPNWMFGLLFERDSLVGVKVYMRFDVERTLGPEGRQKVISRVIRAHNAPGELEIELLNYARRMEQCGFFLRILGIDQKGGGDLRYKFYFHSDGSEDPEGAREILVEATGEPATRPGIEEMFQRHGNGMWGVGISVGALSGVDGFQPYFYPQLR